MRKILFETERLSVGKFLPEDYNDLAEILTDPDVTFFEPYPTFTKEACVQEAAKFAQCGVRRVIAEIDSRNVKSVHLAERLGMRREAFHKELFPDKNDPAQYNDFYIYAILQKEFAGAESKGGASV